jgi:hypothetical protein
MVRQPKADTDSDTDTEIRRDGKSEIQEGKRGHPELRDKLA